MARAADLTAVAAACTMDEPEGSPGYALHSVRSARTLIMQIRTSIGRRAMRTVAHMDHPVRHGGSARCGRWEG